jgi:hypothetical protein
VNFSDEEYVRLYIADTTTWRMLGWRGQTVLMHLLRRFDKSGIFDMRKHDPISAIAAATGLPDEVVEPGLRAILLEEVWVIQDNGHLYWPAYVEAQTCRRSDRLRKRDERVRKANSMLPATELSTAPETSCNTDSCHSGVTIVASSVTDVASLSQLVTPRRGEARQGEARQGEARRGEAGRGEAPEGVQGEPGRTDSMSDSEPLTHSQPPVRYEPNPTRPPAVDRMALAMAARDPLAQSLFEAWREGAGKPGARLDGKGAALWARLAAEGVTCDEVRKAVTGAKTNHWAVHEAKLMPSAILGSAEQREKFCELADHPPELRPNDPNYEKWGPGRGNGPQPNDPEDPYQFRGIIDETVSIEEGRRMFRGEVAQ